MPLLDHFHLPLSRSRHWESFLAGWTVMITGQLNLETLPARTFAAPYNKRGKRVDIDAELFDLGSAAAVAYTPPAPALSTTVELVAPDQFEVQIRRDEEDTPLLAVVELIGAGNKDRRQSRDEILVKCAAYLRQGVGVVLVDIVTRCPGRLHEELLEFLEIPVAVPSPAADQLYAAAYRVTQDGKQTRLEVWSEPLAVGKPLPTLPLWLGPTLCVPLRLEPSYLRTCDGLRIPPEAC